MVVIELFVNIDQMSIFQKSKRNLKSQIPLNFNGIWDFLALITSY